MPSLCRAVEDSRNKGKFVVPEVVGDATAAGLSDVLKKSCGRRAVKVEELDLTSLGSDDRAGALSKNGQSRSPSALKNRHVLTLASDATLSDKLAEVMSVDSYTILFVSTPSEPIYEADFEEPVQMDLRRRVQDSVRRQSNETGWNNLPLFEKYQFFTPGKDCVCPGITA